MRTGPFFARQPSSPGRRSGRNPETRGAPRGRRLLEENAELVEASRRSFPRARDTRNPRLEEQRVSPL